MKDIVIKNELKKVVDEAAHRIESDAAQNQALRKAIHIVETFLHKRKRVCYGGQAINAQLPEKDKFYNAETSLPDYDFFSPDAKADMDELVEEFRLAGYTEISRRFGIHEGTAKLYVNFMPVADITQVIPDFYDAILEKSIIIDEIHYTDPIFLRMMMYLELSRPRGQVARWTKVYERLTVHNQAHPLKKCPFVPYDTSRAAEDVRPFLVRYVITNARALLSPDIYILYSNKSGSGRMKFLLNSADEEKVPTVFLSPDAEKDARAIADEIQARKESIVGYQNILPAMVALYHGSSLVGLVVQQEACHSILSMSLTKGRKLNVASLETMLTFLIGLYYRKNEKGLLMSEAALLCLIKLYIDLSDRFKRRPTKLIPAFPIECLGYQTTFASLLRAKGARIEAARQKISATRKISKRSLRMTRRG